MKNLEIQGLKELNEKELKAIEGGRWTITKIAMVSIGTVIGGAVGFVSVGPVGAVVGATLAGGILAGGLK